MAKCGNHGVIIPRDKALLHRLYWTEQKTLPEMATMFGVNHKSVLYAMQAVGVPTRSKGQKPIRGCKVCGAPVHRIKHAGNGTTYGRLCKQHWKEHRCLLQREYAKTPKGQEVRKKVFDHWYLHGAKNPEGERSWLAKSRIEFRNVRRLLLMPQSRAALKLRSEVLRLARSSQT